MTNIGNCKQEIAAIGRDIEDLGQAPYSPAFETYRSSLHIQRHAEIIVRAADSGQEIPEADLEQLDIRQLLLAAAANVAATDSRELAKKLQATGTRNKGLLDNSMLLHETAASMDNQHQQNLFDGSITQLRVLHSGLSVAYEDLRRARLERAKSVHTATQEQTINIQASRLTLCCIGREVIDIAKSM